MKVTGKRKVRKGKEKDMTDCASKKNSKKKNSRGRPG